MKFSVLIPVRNSEKFLDDCLNSVYQQSFSDFEVIIIDNGSTDNSSIICNSYCKKDSRFRYFFQENKGLLNSRRTAISLSLGEYLVFLDSDDYIDLKLLETLNYNIQNYESDVLVYSHYVINDNNCHEIPALLNMEFYTDRNDIISAFFTGRINNMRCKCIRSSLFEKQDFYENFSNFTFSEDKLQSINIFKKCNKLQYIDIPLYFYRIHNSNISGIFNYERIDEFFLLNHIIYDELYPLCNERIKKENKRQFKQVILSFLNLCYKNSKDFDEFKKKAEYMKKKYLKFDKLILGKYIHLNIKLDFIFYLFLHTKYFFIYILLGTQR